MVKKLVCVFILSMLLSGCSRELIKPQITSTPIKKQKITSQIDSLNLIDQMVAQDLKDAEHYYGLGVKANRESRWEEAQKNFEKALDILSQLDIQADEEKWVKKFNTLLHEISADYKITLLSLGALSSETSVDAFVEKFRDIDNFRKLRKEVQKPKEEEVEEITYDVPIVWNERVENCIVYFQTIAREPFRKYLCRSGKYIDLMREIMREKEMPQDLAYLPLIESGFSPYAYSYAHAVGPWQFIAYTGKKYGLHRNHWYDERRDFVKSTYAAANYLKDLYQIFDDWLLALAAYNAGAGRINKAIKKQKTRDFWKLRLNKQTRNFVPLYMAATIIAKDPERYGFDIEYQSPLKWDTMKVNKAMDLKAVADALSVEVDTIKELNPELRRGVIPPNYKNYRLRIPEGTGELFVQKYDNIPEESLYFFHKIKRGESVSTIAKKYGVSPFSIIQTNNLSKAYRIYAGDYLKIPNFSSSSKVKKDKTYKYTTNSKGEIIYTVENGDNLSEIATYFQTTPYEIAQANNLKNQNLISKGQKLIIPSSTKTQVKETTPQVASYTVRKGDTLWDIARKFGTTPQKIARTNNLRNQNQISRGQKLVIPYSSHKPAPQTLSYTVRRGDTLWDIAKRFGTTPKKIAQINGIKRANLLKPGQKLKIQKGTSKGSQFQSLVYHTIRSGDTLWKIAQAYKVPLRKLLSWNQTKSPTRLRVGDKIKIYR
jgi:membrane-bound lytic murein transglycosylase D